MQGGQDPQTPLRKAARRGEDCGQIRLRQSAAGSEEKEATVSRLLLCPVTTCLLGLAWHQDRLQ